MGVWETGKTYELDSAWRRRNRLHLGTQEHNCCSPWQVFTPQNPKSKVQMNSVARLILPITLSEEQWENFKRCRKRGQDAENQVPSSQSGPLVLLTTVLLPSLIRNWVFPDPWSWCGQTLQTRLWVSRQHISQNCWMGLEANSSSSLSDC